MMRLTVRWPNGNSATFSLEERDDAFLGRIPSINDVCIQDSSVSRKHAHIKFREEGPTVYDLKSKNGIFLNGTRVSRAILKDGDELVLGKVLIEVSFSSPPSDELDKVERYEDTSVESKAADFEVTESFDMDPEEGSED